MDGCKANLTTKNQQTFYSKEPRHECKNVCTLACVACIVFRLYLEETAYVSFASTTLLKVVRNAHSHKAISCRLHKTDPSSGNVVQEVWGWNSNAVSHQWLQRYGVNVAPISARFSLSAHLGWKLDYKVTEMKINVLQNTTRHSYCRLWWMQK